MTPCGLRCREMKWFQVGYESCRERGESEVEGEVDLGIDSAVVAWHLGGGAFLYFLPTPLFSHQKAR